MKAEGGFAARDIRQIGEDDGATNNQRKTRDAHEVRNKKGTKDGSCPGVHVAICDYSVDGTATCRYAREAQDRVFSGGRFRISAVRPS